MTAMIDLFFRGPVAVVTLQRPPVNAISEEWCDAFEAVLDQLADRTGWTVLHLRSAQKVFAAGADLAQIREWTGLADPAGRLAAYITRLQSVYQRLENLPQVTLCEIAGAALGGGFELALSCDLRVAAEEAKLGLPEVGIGLIPGAGGTQRLTRLCGRGVAARIILTGEPVDGKNAFALGMVQWAVPRTVIAEEAARIADRIAGLAAPALLVAKELIASHRPGSDAGYALEREMGGRLLMTPEAQSRIAAFLDKT